MANKMSKQYKSNHLSLSKVIRLVNFINIHYKKNYLIGNTLFSWGLASKFTIFWALSLFDWPITKKVPKEVFTLNIEKCKSLCLPTYIGSKRMMTLRKATGQSEVLFGTCWWGNILGNMLKTQ